MIPSRRLSSQRGATVFGMESSTSSVEIHRRVGYLPGEFVPYEHLTGREYLDFFGALRGGVDRELVDALADRLQSDLSAKVRVHLLSDLATIDQICHRGE